MSPEGIKPVNNEIIVSSNNKSEQEKISWELENNRYLAEQIAIFEKMLFDDISALDGLGLQKLLGDLPPEIEGNLLVARDRYLSEQAKANKIFQDFRTMLMAKGLRSPNVEDMGKYFFTTMRRTEPKGKVSCIVEGPIIILFCENKDDLQYGLLDSNEPTCVRYGSLVKRKLADGDMVTYLMLSQLGDAGAVKRHELQHFMNSVVFDNFALLERGSDIFNNHKSNEIGGTIAQQIRIKDEILALIRGGDTGERLKQVIKFPGYKKMFVGMNMEVVDRILDNLGSLTADKKMTKDELALIVYRLAQVPFDNMISFCKILKNSEV